jgi:hemoglobin/transferrin/lactoferrin receptor protein
MFSGKSSKAGRQSNSQHSGLCHKYGAERSRILTATIFVSAFATGANAEMDSHQDLELHTAPVSLGKVVVSATRTETNTAESTRAISVIEQEQIETMQVQSVPKLLDYEANISAVGGPRSSNQSVNIRGLEGNKVLQTVDGVRQGFDSGHRPSYFLDPALVKSVEVVKGPAGQLWGSGALGGVVAQNTVDASDLLEGNQTIGGFAKVGYNDNNDQVPATLALAGRNETVDWLLSSYLRDSNDIRLGNGEHLEGSAEREAGALAKAQWQVSDNSAIDVIYRQSDSEGHVPMNASAQINTTSNVLIDRETKTNNAIVSYQFEPESPFYDSTISAYWNSVDMAESRVSDGRNDSTKLDVYGLSLINTSQLEQVSLYYGLDGYSEDFDANRGGSNRPIPPQANSKTWGAYLGAVFDLNDYFEAELGARYDHFETKSKNLNTQRDDDALSPSAALTWLAHENLQVTLRHDQAFRAPSSEELYTTGTHFCMGPGFCNTFVSNPDLEAEKSANTELLTRFAFTPNNSETEWLFEASVFENKVDNFIEQIVSSPVFFPVPDAGTTTWVNVDKATIKGFEISGAYSNQGLNLKLAYGQSRGKDDTTGEDLTNIPADKLSADANYAWFDAQLATGVRLNHASKQDKTNYAENTNNTHYEGYTTGDIYASYNPSSFEQLTLDLSVNNVSDRYYRQAWQELYATGREVIISSRYDF